MTKTITSTLVTTYTYDAANRLATQNGQSIFTWDANGNLLQDGSTVYAYDFANRLIRTTVSGVNTQFAYNGDGIRLRLIEAGALTTYTQDYAAPLPVVLQAKTGTNSTQYVYSLGTRPLAEYEAAAWEHLLPDPLGSVRQIADNSGNATLLKSYEPYGSVLNSQGNATSIFAYAGEQIDSTGLIYLRARYLQSWLGIFLSRDPWPGNALRPGSLNGWSYVEGNPVNFVDPMGTYPQLIDYASFTCAQKRDCDDIAKKIDRLIRELSQRADELVRDPLNLPRTGPRMTVQSHQQHFKGVQRGLRDLLIDWINQGCGGREPPGSNGWYWATRQPPWPRPNLDTRMETAPYLVAPQPVIPQPVSPQPAIPQATIDTAAQVSFWTVVGGAIVYVIWNSKGCLAGPLGCLADWLTPGF